MDPDTRALLTVLRSHSKAARRQLSTLTRLLAELDDRIAGLETNGHPEEGHHDVSTEQDR